MSTYTFSLYDGPIRNVKPKREITLYDAIALIKSDVYKSDIERLRQADNPSSRKTLKNILPYFTFSGTFTKRINDGLKKHSGLLVLDFDDMDAVVLADFKSKVVVIEWVCAAWISPSGNGLKVLVKINPKYHYESFVELEDFFEGNFSLLVDKSGKDVARACFVSCDPDVYYNPHATVYEAQPIEEPFELVQEKSVRLVKEEKQITDQFKINKDLRRVEHVVEQILTQGIDLTNGYEDWQMIAFSLASLGEGARSWFHTVSNF